jgi:hypothetical protein
MYALDAAELFSKSRLKSSGKKSNRSEGWFDASRPRLADKPAIRNPFALLNASNSLKTDKL